MLQFWRKLVLSLGLGLGVCAMMACQSSGSLQASESGIVKIGEHREGEAPAILSVPATLEVMTINGERLPLTLRQRALRFALPPGKHVLRVRYFNLWELDGDDHEIVKSDVVALTATVQSGRRYEFETPPTFESPAAAMAFIRPFSPQIVSFKSTVMVATIPPSDGADSIDDSAADPEAADPETEAQTRASIQRAAAKEVVSSPFTAQAGTVAPAGTVIPKPAGTAVVPSLPVLDRVKALWLELSPVERQAFQRWVGQGPVSPEPPVVDTLAPSPVEPVE